MEILAKNITERKAFFIQDKMLEEYAYWVEVVNCEDGTYMVVGNYQEKECYDDNWFLWDENEEEDNEDE